MQIFRVYVNRHIRTAIQANKRVFSYLIQFFSVLVICLRFLIKIERDLLRHKRAVITII